MQDPGCAALVRDGQGQRAGAGNVAAWSSRQVSQHTWVVPIGKGLLHWLYEEMRAESQPEGSTYFALGGGPEAA